MHRTERLAKRVLSAIPTINRMADRFDALRGKNEPPRGLLRGGSFD
jgi:hypothetical protein